MKKLFVLVALFVASLSQAQIDVSINPLGALFGAPEVSGEYLTSDAFGVELSLSTQFGKGAGITVDGVDLRPTRSGFGVKLLGKYYFSPDQGGDGWYGGLYLRQESSTWSYPKEYEAGDYKSSVFAAGVQFGKKWVFDSGFLIEAGVGVGRPISETRKWVNVDGDYTGDIKIGIDFTGRFAIGYRFGN